MNKTKKRQIICCVLGGAVYALFYAVGWQMENNGTSASFAVLMQMGFLTPLFIAILAVILRLSEKSTRKPESEKRFSWQRSFFLLVLCYLPMFVIMYPGIMGYDSPYQVAQVLSGEYSTHHPLLHTLMLGLFTRMSAVLGGFSRAMALYTLMQMLLLALFFSQTCASIARFAGKQAAGMAQVFFALHPMHMIFAAAATKDVLFAGLFAWMIALMLEFVTGENHTIRKYFLLVLCGILSCLLRNNMIYAILAWGILVLVPCGKCMQRITTCTVLMIVTAFGLNQMLQHITSAENGDAREMLSLPIQQIARVFRDRPQSIETDERILIDEAFDHTLQWSDYDPTISDPIKNKMLTDVIKANPKRYAKLYIELARRCPDVYLDAAVELISPYIYPYNCYDRSRALVETQTKYEDFEAVAWKGCLEERHSFAKTRNWLSEHVWQDGADAIPIVRWLFNTGLMVWFMLFFALREIYAGRCLRFAVCLLPVFLWGTYLLGPIMNGRYAYAFLCVLPVLAARPFLSDNRTAEHDKTFEKGSI